MIPDNSRRHGKSLIQAIWAAEALRQGKRVILISSHHPPAEVVGVPGFNDGRQIEHKPPASHERISDISLTEQRCSNEEGER